MKRLIKADLTGIVELLPVYWTPASVEQALDLLRRGGDFLFLARRGRGWLSDFLTVYTQGSEENRIWTYGIAFPHISVAPLFLHVDESIEGRPWGSVTILDYPAAVRDIETFSPLSQAQRERHIRLMIRRYLRNPCYCCLLEVMEYLKSGGESQWM